MKLGAYQHILGGDQVKRVCIVQNLRKNIIRKDKVGSIKKMANALIPFILLHYC